VVVGGCLASLRRWVGSPDPDDVASLFGSDAR